MIAASGGYSPASRRTNGRNPPLSSPDHERIGRALRCLRALLQALVPLPGSPFRKHRGAYLPVFQIGVHLLKDVPDLACGNSSRGSSLLPGGPFQPHRRDLHPGFQDRQFHAELLLSDNPLDPR
jgi:hypothetical protein